MSPASRHLRRAGTGTRPWHVTLAVMALVGCAPTAAQIASPAERPQARAVEPAGEPTFREVELAGRSAPSKLWVYLPSRPVDPLPMVFVAPAGSAMFHGMRLADGDRDEHLPYARAGFGVVAYEVDGALGENASDEEVIAAVRAFQRARAGVENANRAIEYALANIPNVDRRRLFVAGHSSAAAVALLTAAHNPQVRACVAFAPATAPLAHLPPAVVTALSDVIPDFAQFMTWSAASSHVDKLTMPLFLFHARDDSKVPFAEAAAFARTIKEKNPQIAFVAVPEGDHYDSMIQQGIPRAIEWLKGVR